MERLKERKVLAGDKKEGNLIVKPKVSAIRKYLNENNHRIILSI